MRSMLRAGQYEVTVNGARAGFVRVGRALLWSLSDPWQGGRPSALSVRRTGPLLDLPDWRQEVARSGLAFRRGLVVTADGGVPSEARGGGGLMAMGPGGGGGGNILQLDPGVVGLWSGGGGRRSGSPTLGYGYVKGALQGQTEVFVPLRGTSRVEALTVAMLRSVPDATAVARTFQRLTGEVELDYGRGGQWKVVEFTAPQRFWQTAAQHA